MIVGFSFTYQINANHLNSCKLNLIQVYMIKFVGDRQKLICLSSVTKSQGRDMVFNTTFNNISVILYQSVLLVEESGIEFESRSWGGVLDTTLYHKVCQWLVAGWRFSPGTPVSSTSKTDHHNITKILFKVTLNTITHYYTNTLTMNRSHNPLHSRRTS